MKVYKSSLFLLSLVLCLAFPFYACDEEENASSTSQNSQSSSQQTSDESTESGTQGSDEPQNPTTPPPDTTPTLRNSDAPVLIAEATQIMRMASEKLFMPSQEQNNAVPLTHTADKNGDEPLYTTISAVEILSETLMFLQPFHTLDYIFNAVNDGTYYWTNYDVGTTIYAELPSQHPFAETMLPTFSEQSTILAMRMDIDNDCLSFVFELTPSQEQSARVTVHADIRYNHDAQGISKIVLNTYSNEDGIYRATAIDNENAQAYFLEYTGKTVEKETFLSSFSSGILDYRASRAYPFLLLRTASWTLQENGGFSFTARTKRNENLKTQSATDTIDTMDEQLFANAYNEAYHQVFSLPFRTEKETLSLHGTVQSIYLNEATMYGMNVSKCEWIDGKISFSFLSIEQMQTLLQDLLNYGNFANDPTVSALITGAKNSLIFLSPHYTGELGTYDNNSYTLLRELPDNLHIPENTANENRLLSRLKTRKYQLTDGQISLTFLLDDEMTVQDAEMENTDGFTFEYNQTEDSYSVYINPETTKTELTVPSRHLLCPVTTIHGDSSQIQASPLEQITLPSTFKKATKGAFASFLHLKKVNFLGTLDQWVEITFEEATASPTYLAKDLYVQNQLVTTANVQTATKINAYTFANCQSLTKIILSNQVQYVAPNAFIGCEHLTANDTYEHCYYLSYGGISYRFLLRAEKQTLTIVTLHENTQCIGNGAFENFQQLKNVTWNKNLQTIGERAFANCRLLKNCTLYKSIEYIGKHAFINCDDLQFTIEEKNGWYLYQKTDKSDLVAVDSDDLLYLLTTSDYEYHFTRKKE